MGFFPLWDHGGSRLIMLVSCQVFWSCSKKSNACFTVSYPLHNKTPWKSQNKMAGDLALSKKVYKLGNKRASLFISYFTGVMMCLCRQLGDKTIIPWKVNNHTLISGCRHTVVNFQIKHRPLCTPTTHAQGIVNTSRSKRTEQNIYVWI